MFPRKRHANAAGTSSSAPRPSLDAVLPIDVLEHVAAQLRSAELLAASRSSAAFRAACASAISRFLSAGLAACLGAFTPCQRLVLLARSEAIAVGASDVAAELKSIRETGRCREQQLSWVGQVVHRLMKGSWLTEHAELIAALALSRWCDGQFGLGCRSAFAPAWARLANGAATFHDKLRIASVAALAGHHVELKSRLQDVARHSHGADDGAASRRQRAAEAGALEAVAAAMRAHPKEAGVQVNACGALLTIVRGLDDGVASRRQRATEAGALEAVVAAMRAHPQEAGVQQAACGALNNTVLGADDGVASRRQRAAEAGALEAAVAAMREADVQQDACRALRNIVLGADDGAASRRQRAAEAGALASGLVSREVSALMRDNLSREIARGCLSARRSCEHY